MHSRIFQLSPTKLDKDEWLGISDISEFSMGLFGIDYVSDYDIDRNWDLENLAHVLPKEVFKVEGDKIEIISDGSCLWEAHKKKMLDLLNSMEYCGGEKPSRSYLSFGGYSIARMGKNMLDIDYLFYIDNWDGGIGTANDLLEYAIQAMKDDKFPNVLYINSILDYHF